MTEQETFEGVQAATATGRKLTGKQESFCQNVASGMNPSEAYQAAGYSGNGLPATVSANAYNLGNRTEIVQRVAELRQGVQERIAWTRKDFLDECWTNVEIAREPNGKGSAQIAAANGALAMIGKVTGHLTDKPQPQHTFNVVREVIYLGGSQTTESRSLAGAGPVVDGEGVVVDDEPGDLPDGDQSQR